MTDIKEKLSALYDGELESSQIDDLLEECRNNDELIRSFSLYGLISLSLNQESKVSQISQSRRRPKRRGFADIWLSNAVTAAASIILTLFVVNNVDISRMSINIDSTNQIASAVNSQEAKQIAENSNAYLVDHVMNVINDPSFMNSKLKVDLQNVGYRINQSSNPEYSNGVQKFKLRIENRDFGLNQIR
ncbi:MAG: hypothetical protein CMQ62_05120, partial [Gammaproteobacteria bacterium]|nr:hypothetical protein [Gammaproteobacteria bacterium]